MSTSVDLVIESKMRDLIGDFKVRRVLPSAKRRMVGPFVFLDQMGPEILGAGKGLDVAPHPHIGLATVTYLFEGELLHRDSLGSIQPVRPGEVNWMTAGRGIAHSERTPTEERKGVSELFGLQSWVALPLSVEESDPTFAHHPEKELPLIEGEGKRVRLIAGSLWGEASPVVTASDLIYADVSLEDGAKLSVAPEYEERAVYIVSGAVEFSSGEGRFEAGRLVVFKPGEEIILSAGPKGSRLMLLGGEPLEEKRYIWWNFVSSSQERIEQAKKDWREGDFAPVVGETEFIPLPDHPRPPVPRYP
ncbi:MAG: pirin family protein [Pyrinomonadaceae bacterium]